MNLNQVTIYSEKPTETAEFYKKLDADAIKEAAKTYLNTSSYVKVSLFPEKK